MNVFEGTYTHLHKNLMQHDIPQLLRALMEVIPGKQKGLAKRLGRKVSQPQVSRWLKGSEPEVPNYERVVSLATELGIITDMRSEDVAVGLPEPRSPKMVRLKGYVGAGSQAHYYALADQDLEEVEAPPGASDKTVAVEIKGSSMGKALESWLVFYHDVRTPVSPEQINQLCVVGLADDRILIKRIERRKNGKRGFDLISNNPEEPTIEDAQIEWSALVTDLRRRR